MVKVKKDLTGMVFERLKVINQVDDYVDFSGRHHAQWLCECLCEAHTKLIVRGGHLTTGNTKSCGCLQKEKASQIASLGSKTNEYDLSGEYGIGYVFSNKKPFYFDLEDYDKIKDYCWYEKDDGAIVCKRDCIIYMHRLVMNAPDDMQIDHIFHQRNDNRKENLRLANNTQNTINRQMQNNNTSGCVGVSWNKRYQKWHSYISIYNKRITLGYFDDYDRAVRIRKDAELRYFGEWRYQDKDSNSTKQNDSNNVS